MKTRLGRLEIQMLAYTHTREMKTVRLGELTEALGLTASQERGLLNRLTKARMIVRVSRGLYMVPPRLQLGGEWSPDESLVINTLMNEQKARYQICGPNAFNRYGFDEQLPVRLYAYNTRLSGDRTIGNVALSLIRVAGGRLGDTEEVESRDGLSLVFSSRVRTLVDAVYDWSRFGSLPRGYEWIRRELATGRVRATQLVECTLRYGDIGTTRRMGFLLERERVGDDLLTKLEQKINPTSSPIPWIPTMPKLGRADKRWGVVYNG